MHDDSLERKGCSENRDAMWKTMVAHTFHPKTFVFGTFLKKQKKFQKQKQFYFRLANVF